MARAGDTPPESFLEEPQLTLGLEVFWMAFWDLVQETDSKIPWAEMEAWSNRYDLGEDTFRLMVFHLRKMEIAYKEYLAKKQKERQDGLRKPVQSQPDSPLTTLRGKHGKGR